MGVIIWRTQHKNMKGIKAIYIILISWTVDCYPLAESVGLSHGSTGPSQGAVAASSPAVHHVSHGAVAQTAAGYDEYEKPDPFQFEYGVHDDRIQHVDYKADGHYGGTVMEVKYTGEARHPESYGGYHAEHGESIVHDVVPSYHIY